MRVARRQPERLAPGHEKCLAPGIAIGALGDRDQRHIVDARARRAISRAAVELAVPAVDQHEIGPGGTSSRASVVIAAPWRIRRLASATGGRRGVACVSVDQPLEAPLQHLAHHAVIVAGRDVAPERILNLRYWFLRKPSGAGDDHGADRVRCPGCGCCRRPRSGAARAAGRNVSASAFSSFCCDDVSASLRPSASRALASA